MSEVINGIENPAFEEGSLGSPVWVPTTSDALKITDASLDTEALSKAGVCHITLWACGPNGDNPVWVGTFPIPPFRITRPGPYQARRYKRWLARRGEKA